MGRDMAQARQGVAATVLGINTVPGRGSSADSPVIAVMN